MNKKLIFSVLAAAFLIGGLIIVPRERRILPSEEMDLIYQQLRGISDQSAEVVDNPCSGLVTQYINGEVGYQFAPEKKAVCFGSALVSGIDLDTFVILDRIVAKDARSIYCENHPISGPDVATFVNDDMNPFDASLDSRLFFDKDWAYVNPWPLGESCDVFLDPMEKDLARFQYNNEDVPGVERLGYRISRYKGKVYLDDNGPHAVGWNSEKNVDGETYEIIDAWYAKDASSIYFDHFQKIEETHENSFIPDPKTFRSLGNGFGTDGKHVFGLQGKALPDIDAQTVSLEGSYLKDKDGVWYKGTCLLSGVKPEAFQGGDYGIYKDVVYWGCDVLKGADAETFHRADNGYNVTGADLVREYFYADKNHVYYSGVPLQDSFDGMTFLMITNVLGKDKKGVYDFSSMIYDSDSATHEAITRIKSADPETIVGLSPVYAKDKKAIYCGGTRNDQVHLESFHVNWKPYNRKTDTWARGDQDAEDKDATYSRYSCERTSKK